MNANSRPAIDNLTLLVPGLAGPDTAGIADARQASRALTESLPLPGLSALLAESGSAFAGFASSTLDGLLAEAFNVMPAMRDETAAAHRQWPAGAFARQGALGDAGGRMWMRADPVHLRADMGRLLVFPPPMLGLNLAQSSAIAEWLNAHEHFPGPALAAISGTCWVAEVDDGALALQTVAPSVAHGEDADRWLPSGDAAREWHARMNEIQMLLNQCPINAQREARGEAAVNSVWFWGAGVLPAAATVEFAEVCGDHDAIEGLAGHAGVRVRALPDDGAQWLRTRSADAHGNGTPRRQLLVLDALQVASSEADVGAWQQAMVDLDQRWLQALAAALAAGDIRRIELHSGRGAAVIVRRDSAWRAPLRRTLGWLGKSRPLAEHLARLRESQRP